ncbi:MAG TPA: S1 RNA-binding domain-containing protein [Chloroflexi bacterium]|jgi:small subunit ribosomal protein S1|nr:S1 RNA-binding domain-containing protein [Chloroflexota bacterium]
MTIQTQGETQSQDFAELISGPYDYTRPRRGEVREAVILEIGANDIVVNLGAKRDGIIASRDLQNVADEHLEGLQIGDRIPVVILRDRGEQDGIPVSYSQGLQGEDWLRAQELLDSGETIKATIVEENRGGLLAEFGHLRGFIPNSHLGLPMGSRPEHLQEAKAALVGQELELVVIEVNQRRRRLILSKRVADRHKRAERLSELTPGEVRRGIVRSIVDFGAFVDLGGVDGLVHISEIAHHHVTHPSEVLSVGDEVDVFVLGVDQERERISLSRKRVLPDPWDAVTESLQPGDVVDGTATHLVSFGAFVDLGQGVEGLVHSSEIPDLEAVRGDLEAGSPVRVRILDVDHERKRIALRLEEAWPSTPETPEAADTSDTPVDAEAALPPAIDEAEA